MTTIRLATEQDIPNLARTITRAFVDDPVMRWLFPEDDDYETSSALVNTVLSRRWQHTESQWCTDDGVAVAGWVPPGRPEVPEEVSRSGLRIDHPEWRVERFKAIGSVLDEHTPEEPHWYLNMLATHPDWQRRGLGAALMGVVFDRAAREGVACYLETETEDNVAYYQGHGFTVRSEWDVPLEGPHMWGMIRPAP